MKQQKPTPESHCKTLASEFDELFTAKYMKGAEEHGPGLWKLPAEALRNEAYQEAMDLVSFLGTQGEKLQEIVSICDTAIFTDPSVSDLKNAIAKIRALITG